MTRRPSTTLYRVWCVLYDLDGPGRMGDGLEWRRFSREADAVAYARGRTIWGQPATVSEEEVRRDLAERCGCSDAKRVAA